MIPPTSTPPEKLARTIEEFFTEHPNSVVLEEGEIVFALGPAQYSISTDHAKCVLHLWSAERNSVRRVVAAESKSGTLRLNIQKFGHAKSTELEIRSSRDGANTDVARKSSRNNFRRVLQRILRREFSDYTITKLTSAVDLKNSFGPAYTRAVIRKGRTEIAVIGTNPQELQSTIDGILAGGLLWLQLCRENSKSCVVEGLHLYLPEERSATVRARMAHLSHIAAKFRLYEVEAGDGRTQGFDTLDSGNISTRLVRAPDRNAARERFADELRSVKSLVPECEVEVISSAEVSFRFHGLEFARARASLQKGFQQQKEVVFGAGPYETSLTPEKEQEFADLMKRLANIRRTGGNKNDPLYRMQPEKWLESLVMRDICALDARLDTNYVYSQVPAFAAADRAMIDVLTCTRDGRLVVIELKASEDLQLPMQGLDYWSRVNWHHQRGEFQRFGYFAGRELSSEAPLLFLVSPALQVHPSTDVLLSFLTPRIECTVIGIDERWREGVRVLFRKSLRKP